MQNFTVFHRYRHYKAEYGKRLAAKTNNDTQDIKFMNKENESKRQFIKKRDDKKLTAEE